MTNEEISEFMGWFPHHTDSSPDSLVMRVRHLVAKAVAAEREACAMACEDTRIVKGGEVFAAKIRARGNT